MPKAAGQARCFQLPVVDHPLLVAWCSFTSGQDRTICTTRRCPEWAIDARHGFLAHAMDAELGRDDQWFADSPRRLAQGHHRPGAQVPRGRHYVLRNEHLRGPDALDQVGQFAKSLHRLDDRTRSLRSARLERVHGVRDDAIGWRRGYSKRRCTASSWQRLTFGSPRSGSCCTWSRCTSPAITQGLMWRELTPGRASSPTRTSSRRRCASCPFYWIRVLGGGMFLGRERWSVLTTCSGPGQARPAASMRWRSTRRRRLVGEATRRSRDRAASDHRGVTDFGRRSSTCSLEQLRWHRRLGAAPVASSAVWVVVAVGVGFACSRSSRPSSSDPTCRPSRASGPIRRWSLQVATSTCQRAATTATAR